MPGEAERTDLWERDERAVAWVYGSILTGAAVVGATVAIAEEPGEVLLYTAATMVIVWLAHVYAAFVGHGGRLDAGHLGARLLHAMTTEAPVLASALPTLAATAVAWAVGADVSTVGLVGMIAAIATMELIAVEAARRSGAGPAGLAGAALGAFVLGALLIFAKVALK